MKLQLVPARTGPLWMRQGMRVFWRQPIALSGLFFMFMGLMTIISLFPLVGGVLAMLIFPACSLGLMAATREALQGRFPMPRLLLVGLMGQAARRQQMIWLGVFYVLGFGAVLALSALADGGDFARLYLGGSVSGRLDKNTVEQSEFQLAVLVCLMLYIPLSALFWHAPALVHWHGVPAVKSLFFSLMACLGNWKAMLAFIAAWAGVYISMGSALLILSALLDAPSLLGWGFMPLMFLLTAMFFCSGYFTFRDSFQNEVLA